MIDPEKQWRASEVGARALSVPHDQHVIAWITALARLLGERVVTDNWRTPRLPLAASAVRAYNRKLYWQIRRERAGRHSR